MRPRSRQIFHQRANFKRAVTSAAETSSLEKSKGTKRSIAQTLKSVHICAEPKTARYEEILKLTKNKSITGQILKKKWVCAWRSYKDRESINLGKNSGTCEAK